MNDIAIEKRLDELLKEHNPCNIQTAGGTVTCRGGTPCCHNCKLLGAKGCTVNSIACKFYFCKTAWAAIPADAQREIFSLGQQFKGTLRARFDGGRLNSYTHGVVQVGNTFMVGHRGAPFVWL